MMRLIDADALKAIRFHDLPYSQIVPANCDTDEKVHAYKLGWNDAIDAIVESVPTSVPTVDTIKVVRCKDCKHSKHWYRDKHLCYLWSETGIGVFEDGYCSYGERREDGRR